MGGGLGNLKGGRAVKAIFIQADQRLRQRHRNNPHGEWQALASLAERLPQRVVEVFSGEAWERVEFARGGHGRRSAEVRRRVAQAGAAAGGRRSVKKKEKKGKIK